MHKRSSDLDRMRLLGKAVVAPMWINKRNLRQQMIKNTTNPSQKLAQNLNGSHFDQDQWNSLKGGSKSNDRVYRDGRNTIEGKDGGGWGN